MDKPTPVAYEADSSGNIYVEESDGQIWPTGCRIPRLASSRITAEEMKSALNSSQPTDHDLKEGRVIAKRLGLDVGIPEVFVVEGTVADPTLDSHARGIRTDDGEYVWIESELEEGKRVRVTIEVLKNVEP